MTTTFRGFPACPCQVTWLPVYEHELQRRGIINGPLDIAQLIGGFIGSGGTHTTGGASDLWLIGVRADLAVWVARQMGADATWHRLRGWDPRDPSGGSEHVHAVLRGCPHLSLSAQAQIISVDAGGDGLGGTDTPDPGPRPLSGRTWQQGIQWQQEQEGLDMDEAQVRKIVSDEVRAALRDAGDLIKVRMVENEPRWSLERGLRAIFNRKP